VRAHGIRDQTHILNHVVAMVAIVAIKRVDSIFLRGDGLGCGLKEANEVDRVLCFGHSPS